MGDPKGFLKAKRRKTHYRPVTERVKDFKEVELVRKEEIAREQGGRCMDCGIPFCHWGCPVGNLIPEWNDAIFKGQWEKAYFLLQSTNNLPEMTGRLCPAPCEHSCVLGINDDPVTIRENELSIIEYAFREGYAKPNPPQTRTGKKTAVVGSGPAGLACADQLNKAGHQVTVFERDDKIGGMLQYGIPDFKLEKHIIQRRVDLLKAEGIEFKTKTHVGINYETAKLLKEFDAVCLAGGSRDARDLKIEGRELRGIHFAMDFLTQNNRRVAGEIIPPEESIHAGGKKVVVIGGGDTGSDCIGTSNRHGALSIAQLELLPCPPQSRPDELPWPKFAMLFKSSTSHEEGAERQWQITTKKFIGENGHVKKLVCARVEFPGKDERGYPIMREVPGSEFELETDLVLLAIGFLHPEHEGMLKNLGVELDGRGNVKTGPDYKTSIPGVFAAGDMRRGQSWIVWAISEGRRAARVMDEYLMGSSRLPAV